MCLFATQFVVGQVLDPRLIGKRINLSPVVILFALIFWGWMWGIIGMLLAVPLTVVFKIVLENVAGLRFLSVLMSGGGPPPEALHAPGVRVVEREGPRWRLEVSGEINPLLRELATYDLADMVFERPRLEEMFLDYYREETP